MYSVQYMHERIPSIANERARRGRGKVVVHSSAHDSLPVNNSLIDGHVQIYHLPL